MILLQASDEPTSALDPEMVCEVLDNEGLSWLIVVAHDLGFAKGGS